MTAPGNPLIVRLAPRHAGHRATIVPAQMQLYPETLVGLSVDDALRLVPLVWNVCGAAQEGAFRAALGLPVDDALTKRIVREAIRDHLLHLCVRLPAALGLRPQPAIVAAFNVREGEAANRIFPGGGMPHDVATLRRVCAEEKSLGSELLSSAVSSAAPFCAAQAPLITGQDAREGFLHAQQGPTENSAASRNASHPLLVDISETFGRGVLWRIAGRMVDLEALAHGAPSAPPAHGRGGYGAAIAARGTMLIRASERASLLENFERIAPTDCAFATGGVATQLMEALPPDNTAMSRAETLLSVLDPCVPARVEMEVPAHA